MRPLVAGTKVRPPSEKKHVGEFNIRILTAASRLAIQRSPEGFEQTG